MGEVWEAFKTAQYCGLLPGIAVFLSACGCAPGGGGTTCCRPLKKIPTKTMFPIVTIGYMGNNVFPARAGEVLRAAILKDRENVSISASLATIVVERIFDAVVMLGFVFFNLGALENMTHNSGFIGNIKQLSIWGAVIFLGALIVFLLAAMFPLVTERITLGLIDKLIPLRFREKTKGIALKFLAGLESLRSPKDALMVLFTTIIIWLLETGKYWFVMQGFDFHVSYFALMLMNGIVNLATTLPSAPGYIGTFDGPGIAVLVAYGVPPEIAAGYTLVLHAALWFPITTLGAYYYVRQPLRWGKDLEKLKQDQESAPV